jgi:hypothetical protein
MEQKIIESLEEIKNILNLVIKNHRSGVLHSSMRNLDDKKLVELHNILSIHIKDLKGD